MENADAKPRYRILRARRPDPSGDPCPSRGGGGDGDGTGRAIRDDAARRLSPPESARRRGAYRPARRRHETSVSTGAGGHHRDRSMAGDAAPGLRCKLRPARRRAGRDEPEGAKGKTMTKMTLKTEGDTHVVVTRRFAASPEAVYRAHTETNLIQKWML